MKTTNEQQLAFEGFPVPAELGTQERLKALSDDPRAEFLPFTDAEKSQAIGILDYLDNPQYPAGLANHLQEIFLRQKRLMGVEMAKRALISVTLEYGDYAMNAQSVLRQLTEFRADLDENHLNPNPLLIDEYPDGHMAISATARFLDVVELRDKGHSTAGFNPLKGFVKRHEKEDNAKEQDDQKNKTRFDAYTQPGTSLLVDQRVLDFASTTRIGEIRKPLQLATQNEQRRYDFWEARLLDTKKHNAAWLVGKRLLEQLHDNATA